MMPPRHAYLENLDRLSNSSDELRKARARLYRSRLQDYNLTCSTQRDIRMVPRVRRGSDLQEKKASHGLKNESSRCYTRKTDKKRVAVSGFLIIVDPVANMDVELSRFKTQVKQVCQLQNQWHMQFFSCPCNGAKASTYCLI